MLFRWSRERISIIDVSARIERLVCPPFVTEQNPFTFAIGVNTDHTMYHTHLIVSFLCASSHCACLVQEIERSTPHSCKASTRFGEPFSSFSSIPFLWPQWHFFFSLFVSSFLSLFLFSDELSVYWTGTIFNTGTLHKGESVAVHTLPLQTSVLLSIKLSGSFIIRQNSSIDMTSSHTRTYSLFEWMIGYDWSKCVVVTSNHNNAHYITLRDYQLRHLHIKINNQLFSSYSFTFCWMKCVCVCVVCDSVCEI